MRRLMTGYAVSFNKRHKRSGYLFQNRYKSVVCEEDSYLLELIRYIHLNPLRAGLVKDLKALDKYRWTGHSTLLGKRKDPLIPNQPDKPNKLNRPNKPEASLAEKTIEDVLLLEIPGGYPGRSLFSRTLDTLGERPFLFHRSGGGHLQ